METLFERDAAHSQLIEDRKSGLGGSDIHHIFTEPPYGCARRVWLEKRGTPPDHPFFGNEATERGVYLEPVAAKYYQDKTLRKLVEVPVYRDPEFPFMLVHADRLLVDVPNRGNGLVEIKVPGAEAFRKMKEAGLPMAYNMQIQWGMELHGLAWGEFIVFWPERMKLLNFEVKHDPELGRMMREKAIEFWGLVENGPAPEKLDAASKACQRCPFRTTCQGEALLAMYGAEAQEPAEFDVSIATLVNEYQEANELAGEADALLEQKRAQLTTAIGDRQIVSTDGARIFYKPQLRETLNKKAVLDALRKLATHARSLASNPRVEIPVELQELVETAGDLYDTANQKFVNKSASRVLRVVNT